MRVKVAIAMMLVSVLPISVAQRASAKTLNDVEHIHNVKAFGKQVLLGTHHGLIRSDDGGKSWRSISLSGEVDFHALETQGKIVYGVNAGNGKLLHSQDSGMSWKDLGTMKYEDIAIANPKKNQIYLTRAGKFFRGNDGLKKVSEIKGVSDVRAVEVRGSDLFVAAGKSLKVSTTSIKNWAKRYAFTDDIADISVSNSLVVVVSGDRIYTSTDGGKSFS